MSGVRVTEVQTRTEREGLLVEVTVRRLPSNLHLGYAPPRAVDLPDDLRAGLRAWLDQAEADR